MSTAALTAERDRLREELEAERKARENAEYTARHHGATGAYKLLCDLKRAEAAYSASQLDCTKALQRAEAAEKRLREVEQELQSLKDRSHE